MPFYSREPISHKVTIDAKRPEFWEKEETKMQYCKLQIGCLVVVLYIVCVYVKDTTKRNISCNPLYDLLMFFCPWAIVFDGITACTVNYLDVVPSGVNLFLHAMFYLFMVGVITSTYVYMVYITTGIPQKKSRRVLMLAPSVLSVAIVLAFLKQIYYVHGKTTNYSMGISVVTCYVSLLVHFFMIFSLIIIRRRTIEKKKFVSILWFMALSLIVLFVQVIYRESLISSLYPTLVIIGMYINLEDPNIRRLQQYNADMVMGFATLVENRDNNTGGHIRRTKSYVGIIMQEMKKLPKYQTIITRDYEKNVLNAAPMHDIGKIATPDHILQKPGKLTDEEFAIMKEHAAKGGEIIRQTFSDLDDPDYEQIAYEVARYHHEKWNGCGYPEGRKEQDIPLHARIMAIADVFDAVSAKRCYRDAMPLETCFSIIKEGAGKDFDPDLAAIFLGARNKIEALYFETAANQES